ncbi:hypothetical protein SLS57_001266 [Botryosphaeria dothidea]
MMAPTSKTQAGSGFDHQKQQQQQQPSAPKLMTHTKSLTISTPEGGKSGDNDGDKRQDSPTIPTSSPDKPKSAKKERAKPLMGTSTVAWLSGIDQPKAVESPTEIKNDKPPVTPEDQDVATPDSDDEVYEPFPGVLNRRIHN